MILAVLKKVNLLRVIPNKNNIPRHYRFNPRKNKTYKKDMSIMMHMTCRCQTVQIKLH